MRTPTNIPSSTSPGQQISHPTSYNPNAKGVMGEFWRQQTGHSKRDTEIEELDDAIGRLNRSINASSYELLALIREFDERAGWFKWSFTDGVSWLRWRCDLGTGTAREKLRIAHALKELPLISEAFAAGNLSYSKVRVMTRLATVDNDEDLIRMARRMTVRHLSEHCQQRSNAQQASTAVARAAQNSRAFRVWHDAAKGTMHFSIELPVEEGELVEKAVEKAAGRLSTEMGTTQLASVAEETSWGSIQADAVVDVMRGFLCDVNSVDVCDKVSTPAESIDSESTSKSKSMPRSTADNHLVMIHVDKSALLKLKHARENSSDNMSPQYPIETVRRLCCDGSIASIIENDNGEPLSVGRKVSTVTTAIRRALWSRDGGCAFPGCGHTRFVDAHHIRHWADGGDTSLENLVLLCLSHHKLVHEGGFEIGRDQSGELFFRRPDGRALPACGYHRDDWIDVEFNGSIDTNTKTAAQNSRALDELADLGIEEPDRVLEQPAEYRLH